MGQARIGEMRLLAKLSSPCLWFGDGRGTSAFNIHMLGEREDERRDVFTLFSSEILLARYEMLLEILESSMFHVRVVAGLVCSGGSNLRQIATIHTGPSYNTSTCTQTTRV
jgi:hypothetical protein